MKQKKTKNAFETQQVYNDYDKSKKKQNLDNKPQTTEKQQI